LLEILTEERLSREIQLCCNFLDGEIGVFEQLFGFGNYHLYNPLQGGTTGFFFNDSRKVPGRKVLFTGIEGNVPFLLIIAEEGNDEVLKDFILFVLR